MLLTITHKTTHFLCTVLTVHAVHKEEIRTHIWRACCMLHVCHLQSCRK